MKIKNKILRRVLISFLSWLLDVGADHIANANTKYDGSR